MTALVNAASLARETPAVYVIEDAHWIDEVSESMLADFLTVIPQTPSLVLITYRPEYEGALTRVHGAQTIALAPLSDSETAALVSRAARAGPLGRRAGPARSPRGPPVIRSSPRRSCANWPSVVCCAGSAAHIVRRQKVAEVSVPATLAGDHRRTHRSARPEAKRTLSAAAVIGSRFGFDLLTSLGVEPVVADLVAAQLIDQVRFTRQPEYVFHHPLIRAVAYESQLKSDRAELHRRLAAAIEQRDPASADENAALIAEHLEAAGDLRAAYGWHMRAGDVVDQPRHRRGTTELGARPHDRRRATRRRPEPSSHAHRPAHHVVRDRLASPCARAPGPLRRTAGVVQPPPGTRRRWPSAWPGW